ncbi:Cell division protein FtsI [Peptidoglycan synthetase] [hydrothermal vent metagenome]|uniref:Cell division protein FtsI [Peptidoglycan synthetase] n=1 Tax=hydrothermal vent metagenome TaxID=652676 RepID=A0A1W1CGN9_9ZZZZ
MAVYLYDISIKNEFYYKNLAKQNIERKVYIKPVRGEILDSKGRLLAMNRMGFSVSIKPHLKRDGKRLNKVVDKLIEMFPDLNKTIMLKVYDKGSSAYNHEPIKVVDFIRYRNMIPAYPRLSIYDDIKIEAETTRYYPYNIYAAHIVGYTGRSNRKENDKDLVVKKVGVIGKSGLEREYNKVLQGELGYKITKVTATNEKIEDLKIVKPIENRNLELNLDIDLQIMIYKLMKDMSGAVIVMKTNGDILAAVSTPSYDPNLFVGGISKKNWLALQNDIEHPFTNRFIHGTYPPGSTIKMGVAIANSLSNKSTIDQTETCMGYIRIGRSKHKFRCWKKHGHGTMGLRKAITQSCDVFFYNKSLDMGIDFLSKSLKSLGLGVKTGVDLPREYSGVIPDKAWKMKRFKKPWYMGETVIAAIGQGYDHITPMQIARYTNVLATSRLVTPRFAKFINGKEIKRDKGKLLKLDPVLMETIHLGMYDVCNDPTGTGSRYLKYLPIRVAGKTGTSQVVSIPQNVYIRTNEQDLSYFKRSHALLTTYAPFKNPRYIVTTIIEHGGHGGSTNGPIVAEIYKWMFKKGYFNKEKKEIKKNTNIAKLEVSPELKEKVNKDLDLTPLTKNEIKKIVKHKIIKVPKVKIEKPIEEVEEKKVKKEVVTKNLSIESLINNKKIYIKEKPKEKEVKHKINVIYTIDKDDEKQGD